MEQIKNIEEFQQIKTELEALLLSPAKKSKIKLNKIKNKITLKNESYALSFPAKYIRNNILGNIEYLLGNHEKSYWHFKKAEKNSEQAKINEEEKIILYSLLIRSLSILNKNSELQLIKDKSNQLLKTIPTKHLTNNIYKYYFSLMNNYIAYQLSTINIKEALQSSIEIEPLIEKKASTQSLLVYYSNKVEIYFLLEDYKKALFCINKIYSLEKSGIREELILSTVIISLLVHYELGNEDILRSIANSQLRKLKNPKSFPSGEKALLLFFGKTIHLKKNKINTKVKMEVFVELKQKLASLKKDKNDYNLYNSWVESKIKNRPLIDILSSNKKKS